MSSPAPQLADAEPSLPPPGDAAACPRSASRDTRRKAILDIARDTFLSQGFAAASMSAIAAKLGGSKGTLYNYFASKEELFAAVVVEECEAEFLVMTAFEPGDSLEQSLIRFGGRFMRFLLSDTALAFHRLLSAEAARFPELGRLFYAAGPERTLARLAGFLRAAMDAGELRSADPEQASALLLGLFKASLHHRRVWNIIDPLDDAAVDEHVAQAVRVFLHGYAAD